MLPVRPAPRPGKGPGSGRRRALGPVWSKVNPRYGTPATGTLLLGAIAALIAVLSLVIPKVNELISAAVNAIGIVVALYDALTSLAAANRFRGLLRTSPGEALRAVVIPVISALVLLTLGGYLCWFFHHSTDHFAVDAANGWFQLMIPFLMIGSGLLVGAWAKWVRKSEYFVTGRGTDADTADLLAPSTASSTV